MKKKKDKKTRESATVRVLSALGIFSFILACVLIVIMIIMNIPKVRIKYEDYLLVFENLQNKVASLNSKWIILIAIMLLFIVRSNSWIYPITIVYFISAMVFSPGVSFLINMVGTAMMCAFRYYTGMQMGEGFWNKVINNHPTIDDMFRIRGKHSPYTLFVLRLVPFFPFNTVSHIYGTFDFPFWRFMLISLVAKAPRLLFYSYLGNNVYDPLSTKFYIPLAFLLVLTGISLFALRGLLIILPHKHTAETGNEQLSR